MILGIIFVPGCTNKEKARITELEEQLQQAQTRNNELEDVKVSLEQEKESLKQQVSKVNEEASKANELWKQVKEQFEQTEEELANLKEEAAIKDKMIIELQNQLEAQSSRTNELEKEMKKLTSIVDSIREKFNIE